MSFAGLSAFNKSLLNRTPAQEKRDSAFGKAICRMMGTKYGTDKLKPKLVEKPSGDVEHSGD